MEANYIEWRHTYDNEDKTNIYIISCRKYGSNLHKPKKHLNYDLEAHMKHENMLYEYGSSPWIGSMQKVCGTMCGNKQNICYRNSNGSIQKWKGYGWFVSLTYKWILTYGSKMCRVQTLLRFRCYGVHNKVLQMSMVLWEQTQSSMEAWKFEIITNINRGVRRQGGPRAVSSGAVQGIGRVENSMKEAQQ